MPPDHVAHYTLLSRIGAGGMGSVYRARDTRSGEVVALKLLHEHLAEDADYVARFRREARITRGLNSPYIVRVLDSGNDGAQYYLTMDLVEGTTLAEHLATRGSLPAREAASIALQIALALEEAHRHGVVHRDVSPQNVIIDSAGYARVTDFGIARDLSGQITMTTQFIGKPQYASPDQWSGRVDIRSDIYSLGIVLYQMLTGAVPFNAPTPLEVMRMHEERMPPPLTALSPNTPPGLDGIVRRCLEKRPERRYQEPSSLARDLQAWLSGGSGPPPPSVRRTATAGSRGNGPLVGFAVLGGVGLVSVVLALSLLLGQDDSSVTPPPPTLAPAATSTTPPAATPRPIPSPTPQPPVNRSGATHTCANGPEGCFVNYTIGPVRRVGSVLRIDFVVSMQGPPGGTTTWTNDIDFHASLKANGERGIGLAQASNASVFSELSGGGGIALFNETFTAGSTYTGWWEFVVTQPPGTLLLLNYPDFPNDPAPIMVPEP